MFATYLNDTDFLKRFDLESHKIQYTRITVLDFSTEEVLAYIEGKTTGGSITINSTSNMRRVANCSLLVDPNGIKMQGFENDTYQTYGNILEVENLISINKKIKLETGFENTLSEMGEYSDYDIIWFPLGTYVIKTASVSKNNSGTNISLTLHDKCAMLNGDMGGVLPAAMILSENDVVSADGSRKIEKTLIRDIIKNLVVNFGGENPENVLIQDVPEVISKIMKWNGEDSIYLAKTFYSETGDDEKTLQKSYLTLTKNVRTKADASAEEWDEKLLVFSKGDLMGYIKEPFVYPGTLECSAGETVASILNKIKTTLGNYEWYYDLEGRFHFQEVKNYINESYSTSLLELTTADYLSYSNLSKTSYDFNEENKSLITSISSAPQYQNIKNDFIIWGSQKTASGNSKPIRYHLAFDSKPEINKFKERLGAVVKGENSEYFLALLFDGKQKNTEYFSASRGSYNKNYYYLMRKWR